MSRVRGTSGRRRIIAVGIVALLLGGCGGDSPASVPDATPVMTMETTAGTATMNATGVTPSGVSGGSTPAAVNAAPTASPSSEQPFVSNRAELGPIVWTAMVDPATLAPIQPVETFPIDTSTIYAAVPVRHIEPGTVITASWTYNGTPINGVGSTYTAPGQAEGVWLEFHLTRTSPETWPDGTLAMMIYVDGQPALTSSIAVGPRPG